MKILLTLIMFVSLHASDNQALIKELKENLMAPCCWSGTVYDHGHAKLEAEITEMVNSGKTKAEIMEYYEQQYGERILAIPAPKGFNLLAWLAPIFMGLAAFGVIFIYVKANSASKKVMPPAKEVLHEDQIERELKNLDK